MTNFFIYEIASREIRMVVTEAANPDDPAWLPQGHAMVVIPSDLSLVGDFQQILRAMIP